MPAAGSAEPPEVRPPTPARVRWDARYLAGDHTPHVAASFLVAHEGLLPSSGAAVDIGGGAGRNAVWLAERGLTVTLVDVSPVALDRARALGSSRGVSVETIERDVEEVGLPRRSWDVALMHLFWNRSVLLDAADRLAPGGLLMLCQPTVRNLERHERPSRRFLLESGAVAALAAELERDRAMTIVEATEAWRSGGRHDAWLVARSAV